MYILRKTRRRYFHCFIATFRRQTESPVPRANFLSSKLSKNSFFFYFQSIKVVSIKIKYSVRRYSIWKTSSRRNKQSQLFPLLDQRNIYKLTFFTIYEFLFKLFKELVPLFALDRVLRMTRVFELCCAENTIVDLQNEIKFFN